MHSISICSAFYESGRPFLDSYMKSVLKIMQTREYRINLLVAIDDLKEPSQTLAKYDEDIECVLTPTKKGATVSAVRNAVIKKAHTSSSDFLVFLDMDDMFTPDALHLHIETLQNTDISYGDMELVNSIGDSLYQTLYSNIEIPNSVETVAPILEKNFLGLSNTAMHRRALDKLPSLVPEHLIATDWWLYTSLIHAGCTAHRAPGLVGFYRQHDENILGGYATTDLKTLMKRCQIVREHYKALPHIDGIEAANHRVALVEENLNIGDPETLKFIELGLNAPSIWFEEIFRIADFIDKA